MMTSTSMARQGALRHWPLLETGWILMVIPATRIMDNDISSFGLDSHGMTVDHHRHRLRRKPLEPFFSKAGVARFETVLADLTMTMVGRLKEYSGTESVLRLDHVFAALAGDIISCMCIEAPTMSFLRHKDFNPDWYTSLFTTRIQKVYAYSRCHRYNLFHTLIMSMPIFMNFPWIIRYKGTIMLTLNKAL